MDFSLLDDLVRRSVVELRHRLVFFAMAGKLLPMFPEIVSRHGEFSPAGRNSGHVTEDTQAAGKFGEISLARFQLVQFSIRGWWAWLATAVVIQ